MHISPRGGLPLGSYLSHKHYRLRQAIGLSCTYLAHHKLESVSMIILIIIMYFYYNYDM